MASNQKGGKVKIDPRRRDPKLSIAIPSSLVSEVPHLREKTGIIGQVARAAAIYRVEDIYIYRDSPDEAQLIRLILSYLETPQYLRKRLFKKRPELRYVGVLPPLRTPHHPLGGRADKLRTGEFREGLVISEDGEGFLVDIGVEKPLRATGRAPSVGSRATVEISDIAQELRGRFVGRKDIDCYWGFGVHIVGQGLKGLAMSRGFDLRLATSRHAPPFSQVEAKLRSNWASAKSVLIVFGSPRRGLREMLAEDGVSLEGVFNFVVNMIPEQGCETVRTEEAIHAALAVLNIL
jgi:predicted SPOUT superfamily RNA methylase MTH1